MNKPSFIGFIVITLFSITYKQQAQKAGPTIFVWYSQTYKNVSRYLNESLASLNSIYDTIKGSEKSNVSIFFD